MEEHHFCVPEEKQFWWIVINFVFAKNLFAVFSSCLQRQHLCGLRPAPTYWFGAATTRRSLPRSHVRKTTTWFGGLVWQFCFCFKCHSERARINFALCTPEARQRFRSERTAAEKDLPHARSKRLVSLSLFYSSSSRGQDRTAQSVCWKTPEK